MCDVTYGCLTRLLTGSPENCVCNKEHCLGMSKSSFKRRQNMTAPGAACDRCRSRKIKCDTKEERERFEEQNNAPWIACRQCVAAGQPCVVSSSPSKSIAAKKRRAINSQKINMERSRGRHFAPMPTTPPLTDQSLSPTPTPELCTSPFSTPSPSLPPTSLMAPSEHGEMMLRDLDCVCTLLSLAIADRQCPTP